MLTKIWTLLKTLFVASVVNVFCFVPRIGESLVPSYIQSYLLENNYTKLAYLYNYLLLWAEVFEYFTVAVILIAFIIFIFSLFNDKLFHFFRNDEIMSYLHSKYQSYLPARYIQLKQRMNELNNKSKKK